MKNFAFILIFLLTSCTLIGQKATRTEGTTFLEITETPPLPTTGLKAFYFNGSLRGLDAAGLEYDLLNPGSSLPDQTGNAGKSLMTDGTVASWGIPAISLDNLTLNPGANRTIKVGANVTSGSGYALNIRGGDAYFNGVYGGDVYIAGGTGATFGGNLYLFGGSGSNGVADVYLGHNYANGYRGNVFANTPTAGDNSNKVATTQFVTTALSGFSSNPFAPDLTYDGTHFSIDDDSYLKFLASNGTTLFQMYGSGTTTFRMNSPNDIAFAITGSVKTFAQFSLTAQYLYYTGSKRFETTTDGITVTGKTNSTAGYQLNGVDLAATYEVSRTLNITEIKSLHSAPITIVNAPPAGYAIVVVSSAIKWQLTSAVYVGMVPFLTTNADLDHHYQYYFNERGEYPNVIIGDIGRENPAWAVGTGAVNAAAPLKIGAMANSSTGAGTITINVQYRIIVF